MNNKVFLIFIIAAGLAFCVLIIYNNNVKRKLTETQNQLSQLKQEAIEREYAKYNSKTGVWEWENKPKTQEKVK